MAVSCLCSSVLGGVFGIVAAIGMQMGFMADVALVFGAIAGFLCSPALVFGLRYGPMLSGMLWIALPTAVAALVGGALTAPNSGPFLSIVLAIGVYVLASLLRGVVGLKYYRTRKVGACSSCGYDLSGLPQNGICPECGASSVNSGPP